MLDEDPQRLVLQWRSRYADPDARRLWRDCHPAEAQAHAFNAVAQDPGTLASVDANDALRMADDAEAFSGALLVRHRDNDWGTTAQFVRRVVGEWRRARAPAPGGVAPPTQVPAGPAAGADSLFSPETRHLWDAARRSFPRFDEVTGRLMAESVLRLGDGLREVRRPWDRLIALGAARFAADSARAPTAERGTAKLASPLPSDDVLKVMRAVASYAATAGVAPMTVPFPSRHASSAQLALGLARDAFTLDDVLAAEVAKGRGEPTALWRQAGNLNAFATIAIDRGMLMRVPMEEARRFARAALAYSATAAADPDAAPMPVFADGFTPAPGKVALDARACLPR